MKKLFATTLLSTAVAFSAQAQDVTGTIHANQGTQKINKEIYGQFAEHLGSCIYGGLWVGPDSKIPKHSGLPQRRAPSPQGPESACIKMAWRMLR